MDKILVSACLVGDKTRYGGKSSFVKEVYDLNYDLIPVCCEVMGGLSIPRPKSEINKEGKVITEFMKDVTAKYEAGIEKILTAVNFFNIKYAVLKENSPACGVHKIHNGKFDGKLIDGQGLLTRKLESMGIKVFNETEVNLLIEELKNR